MIVLTATADLRSDEPFVAMAITTTFRDPPPDDHIVLPWHPQGRTTTKLRRRSAAVLSWLVEVNPADVHQFGGDVPIPLMIEILKRLEDTEPH